MEGLMRCKIVPPPNLYHPVLPYKYDKKLLFCLCRTCVPEHNATSECQHRSDAARYLEGTWVIDEVRLAVDKGYKILEILEVYEYQVTCYDPATGNGGHFADYIDTFLKLKQEASGYPSWFRIEDDKVRYMDQFHRDEGIRLDRDSIGYNAAKRGLAKLSQLDVGKIDREKQQDADEVNLAARRTVQIPSNARCGSAKRVVCQR